MKMAQRLLSYDFLENFGVTLEEAIYILRRYPKNIENDTIERGITANQLRWDYRVILEMVFLTGMIVGWVLHRDERW